MLLFRYLGDRVSECEDDVTSRTRRRWVNFRERCRLLYAKRFHVKVKGVGVVSQQFCLGVKHRVQCQKESEMGILRRTEITLVKVTYGAQR